jgi:Pentapeptide repeats (9 copies)/Pentapeptide repeats (8 copies)
VNCAVLMDIQELIDRYAAGERNFSSIGTFQQLKVPKGTNLSGANFQRCRFYEVELSEVNLSDSDLSGIVCESTNFRNTNLRFANISSATFWEGTDLSYADLSFANLSQLTVEDATFNGSNMSGVDLSQAYIKGASFQAVNLTQATLRDAWISSSDFRGANLANVDLSEMKTWASNETNGANLDRTVMPSIPAQKVEWGSTNVDLMRLISGEDIEAMKEDYLQFGDRISAIKFLRAKTGLDLAQAKSVIDLIMSQMKI